MTEQQYTERKSLLFERLKCAVNAHCYRVARARINELAQLSHEYTGADKNMVYKALMKQYKVDAYFVKR